jgi:hypothetical protein
MYILENNYSLVITIVDINPYFRSANMDLLATSLG